MNPSQICALIDNIPGGFRTPDHDIVVQSNLKLLSQHTQLGVIVTADDCEDYSKDLLTQPNNCKTYCNEPGCVAIFETVSDYESHFNSLHRFICNECKRSLPTPHLLDLHLIETHDSYFAAKLARGAEPMYACFLATCSIKMNTPQERKEHCIKVHKFPANYRFNQNRAKASQPKLNTPSPSYAQNMPVTKSKKGEGAYNVPYVKVFSFGHPKERVFDIHRAENSLDNVKDLRDALDEIIE